ncbi:MAG TPA: hypothetical protein IAA05_05320 [Candidatus Blautia excrementipullorum]|nr:hypothetical protein [Candidatus Blautia excrementipullorum]
MKWFDNTKKSAGKILSRMRDRRNRIAVSVLAGVLAVSWGAGSIKQPVYTGTAAWWGAMYPEFCFAKPREDITADGREEDAEGQRPKLSFWLAKALDW